MVRGKRYQSEQISLAPVSDKEFVKAHPRGRAVRVRYNRDNPQQSYLDVRFHKAWNLRLILGIALVLAAVVIRIVYEITERQRRATQQLAASKANANIGSPLGSQSPPGFAPMRQFSTAPPQVSTSLRSAKPREDGIPVPKRRVLPKE